MEYVEKERYCIRCAVFLLLTKEEGGEEYTLLQKRYHTGLLDGKYDVACSGHLEANETLKEAMIRETEEEIGIVIKEDNLHFVSTIYAKFSDANYLLVTFQADMYEGNPVINEPDKCNELKWVPMHELPQEIIDTRKIMIENYLTHCLYYEYDYENK